ncbi:cation diffusion facilitator family transporter [Lactonifactor sp. BIOML-A3]|uniref:cation diffusion facilitator family transporter n=1 Tax=unclassified Lactonifactor TaxID=2636670 RepID=UPI0012AEF03A|nr:MULTISPECIES: cation diffusion facilitator family transporter [unclassified Lactonifactor]MSA00794.1 cation diffusion facilitator family transporter [Lactonifactor sp. BIOML-A5]MSA06992.1 cation diffusion facilitator family transporter [Lactonifactor sp. BIOML-A4]MSA11631.1 cation diffusion facilitator family transporter [Lactonifactor sp. BIOML-A3]MSA16224.1 cation diffusion facilitator family transporter [Lactonifactor sp. BIOML-A2]MSA36828.1 cation diffusion facilitator family transporte
MTEYLVRRFVKDYEDIGREEVRTRYGILSSIVGILCNVLLFGIKLLIGMLMHSIAVMADAFNNLSDAASSVISFVGVKMAGKPADKEHPFGHGRMEYIAAFIVAFLVIQVGFSFFKSSAGKLMHPEAITFQLVPFLILVLSVGVKLWMGLFNRKLGKRINSKVMLATSADSMGDAVTTSATLISILICRFAGVNIDAAAGLLVSLMVMWAGISIAKETLEPLIGEAADPELYKKISEMVEAYDGILGTHDLIVHNYGPNKSMASIHAEVPRDADIEESHEIIDRIEREVARELGIFLVIHMDPIEVRDEEVLKSKQELEEVLQSIDERLNMHDFRMVKGKRQINLIFDLVVPFDYDKKGQEELLDKVIRMMQEKDRRYQFVITVDQGFVGT